MSKTVRTGDRPDLSEQQKQELWCAVKKHRNLFQDTPGRTNQIRIETDDAAPIHLPPYRLPKARHQAVQNEVQQLLEAKIIEPLTSPWAPPIVLVPKRDGTLRLCVDYRRLNRVMKPDPYPMARVDDLLDRLGQAKYISTLDLTKGYWQVPVHPESRQQTAFITPFGKYQFLTMPFGLVGAPAVFQDISAFSTAYLDDVSTFSNSWKDHIVHLDEVLSRLKRAGPTVKASKCRLGCQECQYLGHIIGNGRVRLEQNRIKAVQNFERPKKKKGVGIFLDLAGYYRKFIPRFSETAIPLTDATKKDAPVKLQWTSSMEAALQQLKQQLASDVVLASPNEECPFMLQTDAFSVGITGILSQAADSGDDRPITYFSRKLLPREQRYSAVELECLAVISSVQHFRVYLTGVEFTVQTDHKCLNTFIASRMKTAD